MSDHDHSGDHDHEFHSHFKLYLTIFAVLCVFTVVSVLADLFHGMPYIAKVGIVMAVAVCKALCVMLIFMHLKFERAWKYMLLAPTLILACTIPFALYPDIGAHYYTPTAPQIREYERIQAEGGDHSAHGGAGGHAPANESHH